MACELQVCGEAVYCDDLKMHNMLHAVLVVSTRPHAKILSVDATAATKVSIPQYCHVWLQMVLAAVGSTPVGL